MNARPSPVSTNSKWAHGSTQPWALRAPVHPVLFLSRDPVRLGTVALAQLPQSTKRSYRVTNDLAPWYFSALFAVRRMYRISLQPELSLSEVMMTTGTGPSPKQTGTEGITQDVETCPSCNDPIYYRAANCSRCGLRIERGS